MYFNLNSDSPHQHCCVLSYVFLSEPLRSVVWASALLASVFGLQYKTSMRRCLHMLRASHSDMWVHHCCTVHRGSGWGGDRWPDSGVSACWHCWHVVLCLGWGCFDFVLIPPIHPLWGLCPSHCPQGSSGSVFYSSSLTCFFDFQTHRVRRLPWRWNFSNDSSLEGCLEMFCSQRDCSAFIYHHQ